jgi:DNA repair protein RadC
LNGVFAATEAEISKVHGMGMSKYVQLQAVFEMVRRALKEEMRERDVLSSPEQVRNYLCLQIGKLPQEVFVVLFLDAQNRLVESETLFTGSLTQTSVYPREVVKRALHHNAAAVILAHNHPSGLAESSRADEVLTRKLKETLDLVDVRVLDHFVVAGNTALSFAERGLL